MPRAKWDIIVPKPLDIGSFEREFEKAAREAEAAIKANFEEAVQLWRKKPVFRGYVRLSGDQIYISVGTSDEIFNYWDQGTKPHIIRPKNAKVLHWNDGSGEHFAKEVHHPGFKGTKVSDEIEKEWGGPNGLMVEYYENALQTAINNSGHAIK